MSSHSIPQQHRRIPDLVTATAPQHAVPPRRRGSHRRPPAPRRAIPHQLITLGLGAVLTFFVYLIGGPW